MINPIILFAAAALFLSAVAVTVLNKPRFPIVASSLIIILMFFVFSSYILDSAIVSYSSADSLNTYVSFLVWGEDLTYLKLEEAFDTLVYIDIGLFIACLASMFVEAMYILRKNSDV